MDSYDESMVAQIIATISVQKGGHLEMEYKEQVFSQIMRY